MPEGLGPLPLLADSWPLRELLILSYNANLGFFERAGLIKAKPRGARVTLVSDADMVHADHDATRFAGRSYLDARAICHGGGAFHPKLVIALGEERAEILVGSGNTSPGGWISNAELWTMVRATADGAPQAVHRVADLLEALPPLVRFTAGVAEVFSDVAEGLRRFSVTEEGPALVSSAWGPIIDQLPKAAKVSELVLSAPFFDKAALAIERLLGHFDPTRLVVALTEDANFDGAKLAQLVAKRSGTVSMIADTRYHHGKLVEWKMARARYALTGSPNISRSALLESMAEGGNCEVGLVSPVATSLCPETTKALTRKAIAEHVWVAQSPSVTTAPVILLDVVLESRGLRLDLRAPLEEEAELQHHDGTNWVTFATVPSGELSPVVGVPLESGLSVRLLFADGTPSASRSITDLTRTNFRRIATKRTIPGRPSDFELDPRFVTLVEQALAAVRAWSAETSVGAGKGPVPTYVAKPPTEGWRQYIDGFRSEVGDDFGFFVLPYIMGSVGVEAPAPTAVGDEQGEAGDDSAVDEEDLLGAELTERLTIQHDKKKHIERYRRLVEKLVKTAETRPEAVRVAAAVLTAGGVALGCWPSGADLAEFIRYSLRPLRSLGSNKEFRRDAASIAAVNLTLIGAQYRHLEDSLVDMHFGLAVNEMEALLPFAEREDVAFRCAGFVAEGLAQLADPDRVMELVERIVHPDPIADTVSDLIDDGIAAEAHGRRIDILSPAHHAVTAALKTLKAAQDGSPVGVRVQDGVRTVLAAWVDPYLFIDERTDEYRYTTRDLVPEYLSTPQPDLPGNDRWSNGNLPNDVIHAFAQADINLH